MKLKETYSHEFKGWQKLAQKCLGMWRINSDSIDFKWGYFAPRLGFTLILNRGGYFNSHYAISFCLIWGYFRIKLPFKTKLTEGCDLPQYGITIHNNAFWIYMGGEFDSQIGQVTRPKWITIYAPWMWEHEKHLVLGVDNEWHDYQHLDIDGSKNNGEIYKETWPFAYTLENGEVQVREATCERHFRQWRWNWLLRISKKLRIKSFGPKKPSEYIEISFNKEVGERSGSWKGGTVGCGYDIIPGETIKECLNRMQDERKF